MKPSEVLTLARQKISDPKNWTQGVLARDADGKEVDPDDAFAICWCATGAIMSCADGSIFALNYLRDTIGQSIPVFNDRPQITHADVLYAFDQAILRAEQGGD